MSKFKRLVLVRHGKSNHDEWVRSDIERNLNERGHLEAEQAAKALYAQLQCPEIFISSPAIRALTTAYIFARAGQFPNEAIRIRPQIYFSGLQAHLYLLEEIPDAVESVILFGHNPTFYELSCFLSGTDIRRFPTSGVLILKSLTRSWSGITENSFEIQHRLFRDDNE